MSGTQGPARALALLFAVSGAAALVIETTWLRWFALLFGATAPATAATLVAFFAGQAVGAAAGARYVPRSTRPLLVYGGLEIAGALWALTVPIGLGWGEAATAVLYESLLGSPGALAASRFGIALVTTLPECSRVAAWNTLVFFSSTSNPVIS